MEPRETLTISLPAALRERVDAIVRSGDYGNVSEYFRELVRQDLRRRADHQLEVNLLKALDSGSPVPATAEFWEALGKRLRTKPGRKRAG